MVSSSKGKPADDRDADRRRAALRRALQAANMRPADAARAADLGNPNAIYNFFGKRTMSLSAETYRKLAKVIPGATVASLQGLEHTQPALGRTIQVKSEARAGVMRASFDLPLSDQVETPVPIDAEMRASGAYGVLVRRPGAELLYPEGTILVVMPVTAYQGTISNGRKLILQRINAGTVEVTVRELQVVDGSAWLRLRSTDPRYDSSVEMPWPADGARMWRRGEDRFSLAGIVVGSYTPDP